MPASRSVVSTLLRELETFLYTLKAGPAGGRLRRPSSAGRPDCAWKPVGGIQLTGPGLPGIGG
jgi:hypothetical protein